jgi:hypothetical protein
MPSKKVSTVPRAHLRTLLGALVLLVWLIAFVHACGTDDLIFPGDFAPTPTAGNTATPEPTANI